MSAPQPEAEIEYSTPDRGSDGPFGALGRSRAIAFAAALTGVVLLATAEFSPLLRVRTIAATPRLVRTVQTGPHHDWALLVLAVVAALLSTLAWRADGRTPWVLVGLLGLAALGIVVFADLPDVHATGLVGSGPSGLRDAQAHAAIGLYLETLGAVALLLAATAGAVL